MKHSTLISVTTLASLAACQDATAPEPKDLPVTTSAEVALSGADVDSATLWSITALDDAASRLAASIPDVRARLELQAALHAMAEQMDRGQADPAARATLARITRGADASLLPELEAIGLALDQAERVLGRAK